MTGCLGFLSVDFGWELGIVFSMAKLPASDGHQGYRFPVLFLVLFILGLTVIIADCVLRSNLVSSFR